ncbi:MAG: hypothetical protein R3E31_12950 [Chloroflexota bacterium]
MNSTANLETALNEVQTAYQLGLPPESVAAQLRKLAQTTYKPALPLFLDGLSSEHAAWRSQCLLLVGLHYDLQGNTLALDKIRDILRHDPDRQLRSKAAEMLALHSEWPDHALRSAMENDPDNGVCYAACQAILELLGIPRLRIRDEMTYLYTRGVMPTMDDVKRIAGSAH